MPPEDNPADDEPMDKDEYEAWEKEHAKERREPVDWTYSEGCGCQVTFFAASDYHTSRMLPGETCMGHTGKWMQTARDRFIARAKAELRKYLAEQGRDVV